MNNKLTRRQWLRRGSAAAAGLTLAPQTLPKLATHMPASSSSTSVNGFVRLSANENPYGPSKTAREAMLAAFDEACRYPYAGAGGDLAALIAEKEGVTKEHIVIGCGSGEILRMAGVTYGMNGGEIVAADPAYLGLTRYAETFGAYTHKVPLDEYMVHDLDAMYNRITPHVELVFICNPNNPTGTAVDPAKLRDFATSASNKAVLFIDEAYIELMDDMAGNTMVDLVKKDLNVIVSRTFSKIFGMAGQRIGYAITRPDIAKRIETYRMGMPNVVGLRGAMASLQDSEFQTYSRKMIAEGRQYVYDLCDEMGLKYTPSTTNFVFFHTGKPIQKPTGCHERRERSDWPAFPSPTLIGAVSALAPVKTWRLSGMHFER